MDRMGYRHMVIAGTSVRRMDCSQTDSQGMVPPQVVPQHFPDYPLGAKRCYPVEIQGLMKVLCHKKPYSSQDVLAV